MNTYIEVIPLEGIRLDNHIIRLSDSREQVRSVLGLPEGDDQTRFYYYNSDLRIDFDEEGNVKFIEFLGGIDGSIQPVIYGVKAFEKSADELYELLKEHNAGEIDDSENGYSYAFLNSSVGVYRDAIPEDIEEMAAEMQEDGIDLTDNEDLEYEKRKAGHWATLGIGIPGYYL